MKSLLVALLLALVCATGEASSLDQYAAKLATLRERGANPRIQILVAILADAESEEIRRRGVGLRMSYQLADSRPHEFRPLLHPARGR